MGGTPSAILDVIAPQFSAHPNKADFLVLAESRTNACYYGAQANYAIALRAAHLLTLVSTRPNGETGNISSKSEGDLSLSYGGSGQAGNDGDLPATYYGQQLLSLRRGSGVAIGVTGGWDQGCHVSDL